MQHKHQRRMLEDSLMELSEFDKNGCPIHKSEETVKKPEDKASEEPQKSP